MVNVIVLDTETTGLNPKTEKILELAIVDGNGQTLFDSRIKPGNRRKWPEAEAVHGISYNDLKDLKTIRHHKREIVKILSEADLIVGYNVNFDMNMLLSNLNLTDKEHQIISNKERFDVMIAFAEVFGQWNEKYGCYKWQKLITAADYYNYQWTGSAHGALADTLATLYVYNCLNNN